MSSWWERKLLRYGLRYLLSRSGLLDDKAIDLDNLGIAFGKKSVVELRDVHLNLQQVAKLAQLPPCIRLETARVLLLRLTFPADFYQSSIVVEVEGAELVLCLEEEEETPMQPESRRNAPPTSTRTPQHRKTQRRIHSPPPYDPGALPDSTHHVHIPTTAEIAQSFLKQEPWQEREELEATLAANTQAMDESFASESSERADVGTGTGITIPGFLAGFLQGLVDRFELHVRNVQIKIESFASGELNDRCSLALRLSIAAVDLSRLEVPTKAASSTTVKRRIVHVKDISLQLLSSVTVFEEFSDLPSRSSSTRARSFAAQSTRDSEESFASAAEGGMRRCSDSRQSSSPTRLPLSGLSAMSSPNAYPPSLAVDEAQASMATVDTDRFSDDGDGSPDVTQIRSTGLEIQAGDDNISWSSRRSKSSIPADDLWKSMVSEDDLPDSPVMASRQRSAPPSHSSRGSSPYAARERFGQSLSSNMSPGYGSWPRLDESPQRHRQQQGPGSWPGIEQSQHSAFEPLAQRVAAAMDETTDNKKAALEQAVIHGGDREPSLSSAPDVKEDDESDGEQGSEGGTLGGMLTSRVFSHEEAQSMYMSAMTNSPPMTMPGGWGAETLSESPDFDRQQPTHGMGFTNELDDRASGRSTPRAETPRASIPMRGKDPASQMVRDLVSIDWISVSLPAELLEAGTDKAEQEKPSSIYAAQSAQATGAVPGAFSVYSESSKRRGTSSTYGGVNSTLWASPEPAEDPGAVSSEQGLDVSVGDVHAQVDYAIGRLLYAFATRTVPLLKTEVKPSQKPTNTTSKEASQKAATAVSLGVQYLKFTLKERIDAALSARGSESSDPGSDVVNIVVEHIELSVLSNMHFTAGTVKVLLGGRELLTFAQDSSNLSSPQMAVKDASDIDVVVNRDKSLASGRPVTEINVKTTSVVLLLDLGTMDETFNSFGGLSGVLELGGSFLSDSGSRSPPADRTSRGVRFAGDPEQPNTDVEVKTNLRIAGVKFTLKAAPCSAVIRTSTLKAVHREAGVIATVERVLLSGPLLPNQDTNAPVSVELAHGRVEYILTPQDKDLERLLSLLTPSKDKYDNDDDILIDTLLRQRQKGGLLRVVFADAKGYVDNWESLSVLEDLSQDLAKLSAVTKYLPEDNRPGMLTLVRIKDAEATLPVNPRFGSMHIVLQDFHLAHVGLPSLLAFSINDVLVRQTDGPDLVHALIPASGSEGLPMVMARMLGDEEDPTIKVKLFNSCIEYNVPVLLDLTSMDQEVDVEDSVTALAHPVAGMVVADRIYTEASDPPSTSQKKINLILLVHDSAIGLNPQKLESKAVLVLSDAHFNTVMPPEEILSAKLDLRKAAVFVTDHSPPDLHEPAWRGTDTGSTTQHLTNVLTSQGYVSIGSVMSASIIVRAKQNFETGSRLVEVDAQNELLLLETCADSTQTLMALLGALAPPTPPSNQPKYLTEPMTIEDMIASFSGEPLDRSHAAPETLFDVEAQQEDEPDMLMRSFGLGKTANLLAESEMSSSLYGPISGVFGLNDHEEDESTIGEDYPKTVESLLEEEDPFEMPTSPTDMYLDDTALFRDLQRQCKSTVRNEPVDLGLYEIEDLGYDALGSGQQALGTQHRFNAPYCGGHRGDKKQSNLPFRIRLRDCHVIWHLYDGYDWQHTRDGISEAVEQVEMKAEERRARRQQSMDDRDHDESVVGDLLFNSIYIAVPLDHDAQELRRQINRNIDDMISETESVPVSGMSRPTTYSTSGQPRGQRKRRRLKLGRGRNHKIAFELKGISADVLVFPPGEGDVVSSVDVRVKDLEIFDKVPTSTWRKFLTHLETNSSTREMSKPMFHIQMDNVKTLESHSASEIVLKVTVLPLRLHVDQDALDFITRFFEFKDKSAASAGPPGEQPFIQRVEIDTVDMCLDYKPKNIDYVGLRSGRTTEFMNFITLDASNIRLKHAIVYGLRGFDTLHQTLNDVWMPDIQRNQLPTILAGLAPVRSFVNIGSGVRDVVAIPIREYKKDGRIVRSIQKGAFQFGKTTASELARLGAKVALGTQTVLSNAEHFLAPEAATSSRRQNANSRMADQDWHDVASNDEAHEQHAISAYANQPLGVLTGLRSARRYLEHDLLTAKDALIAVRGEFFESTGPGDAAAAVARHAPTVILRPIIGATRAVGTTLLGVGNQIDRGNVRKVEDVSSHSNAVAAKTCTDHFTEIQTAVGIRVKRLHDCTVSALVGVGSSRCHSSLP